MDVGEGDQRMTTHVRPAELSRLICRGIELARRRAELAQHHHRTRMLDAQFDGGLRVEACELQRSRVEALRLACPVSVLSAGRGDDESIYCLLNRSQCRLGTDGRRQAARLLEVVRDDPDE